METAKGFGLPYDKLLLSIAGALHFNNPEDPQSVEIQNSIKNAGLETTILKYTGLKAGDPVVKEIEEAYKQVESL